MTHLKLKIAAIGVCLTACAPLAKPSKTASVEPPKAVLEQPQLAAAPETATVPVEPKPRAETPVRPLPPNELTDLSLYQFLLGDIAVQRGHPELGAQIYSELAKRTRDPRVARRAAQLAIEARAYEHALENLRLWQTLEPDATQAIQMQLTLLLSGGRFDDAGAPMRELLQNKDVNAGALFMQTHGLLVRAHDKHAALAWAQAMARDYPQLAESHWVVAQLAAESKNIPLARDEVAEARRLRPEWDRAVVLAVQLWMPENAPKALGLLQQHLSQYPDQHDVRLFYARALLEHQQFTASREQFQILQQANPANAEVAFAIALLSMQLGELDRAEQELQQSLQKGNKDENAVHYYLAQLQEARKSDEAAIAHYHQVSGGEYAFASRLREAQLLHKAGKLSEAIAALHQANAPQAPQQVNLILLEAQMLREAQQHETAFQVLSDGLKKFPRQPQLLFEAAMTADKLEKRELFESYIRQVIEIAPGTAHAYNALGYSFLERNVRIAEGMKLVEKAFELAPDDAAIIDSVGWGYFRLGELEKSVTFLQRAFSLNPDPEIAAHLGEALEKTGRREESLKLLQEALQANPDHPALQSVIKKYHP